MPYTDPITFALYYRDTESQGWRLTVYVGTQSDTYEQLTLDEAADIAGAAFMHWARQAALEV